MISETYFDHMQCMASTDGAGPVWRIIWGCVAANNGQARLDLHNKPMPETEITASTKMSINLC